VTVSDFRASLRARAQAADPPAFYSVAQAARILGMSEMTLYRAINAGEFPAVRIRSRLIVPRRAIEAMVEAALDGGTVVDAAAFVPPSAPATGGVA
jgi:excisionase family DNA binding protein